MAARLGLPERLHHQSGVPGVVFHQKNVNGALVHEWGRVWKARDKRVRIPAVGFNLKFSRLRACIACAPEPSRPASTLLPPSPPAKNGLSQLAGASARSYGHDMKWNFLLTGMLANVLWFPALSLAQDAQESPAAAAAERENAEANFKQVNVKEELLEEVFRTQQKRCITLVDEIHTMRQEVDRLKSRSESTATQESIKRLADKIEEVDKKRRD